MIRSETHPPQFGITVPYSETRLTAHARDSSDNEISCNLEVFAQTNGVCFATVPYRTTGLGNNDIITKGNLEGLDHTFTGINTVPDLTSNSAGGQVANKNSIPRKTMCNTLSEFKTILPQLSLGDSIYVGNAIRNSNNTGAVAWSWSIYRGHDNDGYHFAEGSGWTGARNVPLFDFVYNDTNETITFRYYSESSGSGLVSQTFNVDVFDPGVNIFKYP